MKKNTLYMLLLLTSTALSISAMTVVGPHYPDSSKWLKQNENTELRNAKSEKTALIVHETKASKCVIGVATGVLLVILVGLGIIFPIVYCGQPGNCSNSTIL